MGNFSTICVTVRPFNSVLIVTVYSSSCEMILSKATSYRKLFSSVFPDFDSISLVILGVLRPFEPPESFLNSTDLRPNSFAGQGVMSIVYSKAKAAL